MDQIAQESFRSLRDSRLAEIEAELNATGDSTKPIAPDVSVGRLSRLDSLQMQQMPLAGKRRLKSSARDCMKYGGKSKAARSGAACAAETTSRLSGWNTGLTPRPACTCLNALTANERR